MNKYYSGRNKNGGEEMPDTTSPTVEFISIAKEFRHEYVMEKSRFITTVYPCSTEEDAQSFIARINKEFWDARHNCTAFALGPKQEQQRSSDNGEPSGTAGKPMLEVLKDRYYKCSRRGNAILWRYKTRGWWINPSILPLRR